MPELPEVETIKRGLEKKIVGLSVTSVEVLTPRSFQGDPGNLIGKTIAQVWRRGKMLGIDLSNDCTLLIHLKMSGQLVLVEDQERFIGGHPTADMYEDLPNRSTRVIFSIRTGQKISKLYFNDQRKFGWIKLGNLTSDFGYLISGLGPEPLDKNFTWQILRKSLFRHPNLPVKAALMDQSVIAGIGNIYASESLFLAKIDPRRRVKDLTDLEFKALKSSIVKALSLGIKHSGATRRNFITVEGLRGGFLDVANVYGRDKESCKVCGSKIQKITQSGRSTYFCQKCQD